MLAKYDKEKLKKGKSPRHILHRMKSPPPGEKRGKSPDTKRMKSPDGKGVKSPTTQKRGKSPDVKRVKSPPLSGERKKKKSHREMGKSMSGGVVTSISSLDKSGSDREKEKEKRKKKRTSRKLKDIEEVFFL